MYLKFTGCFSLIPQHHDPKFWYLWVDLPTDMTCWFGPDGGQLDPTQEPEALTRILAVALHQDDFLTLAHFERFFLWSAKEAWDKGFRFRREQL